MTFEPPLEELPVYRNQHFYHELCNAQNNVSMALERVEKKSLILLNLPVYFSVLHVWGLCHLPTECDVKWLLSQLFPC